MGTSTAVELGLCSASSHRMLTRCAQKLQGTCLSCGTAPPSDLKSRLWTHPGVWPHEHLLPLQNLPLWSQWGISTNIRGFLNKLSSQFYLFCICVCVREGLDCSIHYKPDLPGTRRNVPRSNGACPAIRLLKGSTTSGTLLFITTLMVQLLHALLGNNNLKNILSLNFLQANGNNKEIF